MKTYPHHLTFILLVSLLLHSCLPSDSGARNSIQFHPFHQAKIKQKEMLEIGADMETVKIDLAAEAEIDAERFKEFQKKYSRIAAIGDSLTQGVGDESGYGGHIGMLNHLFNEGEKRIHFDTFAKRGTRSEQLIQLLEKEEAKRAIEQADIVFITIGANDIMQVAKENFMNLTLQEFLDARHRFEKQIEKIITIIRSYSEDAEIYFLGFYNPFGVYFHDIKEIETIVQGWNQAVKKIADSHNDTYFIPIADLFQGQNAPLYAEDHFHPNYNSYVNITNRILQYLHLKRVD